MTTEQTLWRKFTQEYFIPGSEEGLQELVGKPIRVFLEEDFDIMIYADIVSGSPEFVKQERIVSHFVKQERIVSHFKQEGFFTENITGYRTCNTLFFKDAGIITPLFPSYSRVSYEPQTKEHDKRLQWLQEWNMWREVR